MAKVSVYLNFKDQSEEAILFYEKVFGTKNNGIMRFGDVPPMEDTPPLPDSLKNLVMHVELPIFDGYTLMASDAPEQMGFNIKKGNNSYIMLQPDSREETEKLFRALSENATIEQELQDMFWGDYYGSLRDKFGIQWMFNCSSK